MSDLRYRVHLRAAPATVFGFLATGDGRARFWAESAPEEPDGPEGSAIAFRFPDRSRLRARVLACEPPRVLRVEYFGGSRVEFELAGDGAGGTELTLTETGLSPAEREENAAGWVSVLLALKAAVDFGVDLRNHDPARTWREGYVEN
jgi:uncharacterized protein YndB with AHSA1/START domain